MLSFTLLGQTVLSKNGLPLTQFRSQKEAALLIYLAQTGQSLRRDFLADLLWESSTTKQSLTNLRTTLTRLKKNVGDVLIVTRDSLALKPEDLQQVDSVILLQTLNSVGQINSAEKATTLHEALATFQGDFLADFQLTNAPAFEEWMMAMREHIRRQVIIAFEKLTQYALSTEAVELGIEVARQWLAVDALDETAHTMLVQLLLEAGNVHEATIHYEHCVALLQSELGIAPPAKMTALIRDAQPKRTFAPSSAKIVRHNLPAEYDQFFGRKDAQQEIHIRLDQPWCRLVTITGQGGVGKTRLATTVARSRLNQYHDGVWLVELEHIDPEDDDLAEAIAVEIATILDLRLTGSATPEAQLLDHLQHKQMMLVLDNIEHLLAGKQIILDIVQRCEQVQLLITSREALRIRAEWSIPLTGLAYPTSEADEMPSDAVELFAARRAQQQLDELSSAEIAAIRTICRLVEGLPLAIELAAALTSHTSCQTVANSLSKGFNVLAATLQDVPQRHRGLHVVFDASWQTLSPALQQRLARLSIFRGGFTEEAAQQIADTGTQHFAALAEKSLLGYDADANRYVLHPVIRAYAAERRPVDDKTPQKHAHYFLTLLAHHTEPLQKERPQDSMAILEPEIDNVRRAWQTGLTEHRPDLLIAALTSLSIYYQLRGLAHEGESVMHATMQTAKAWGDDGIPLAVRAGLERARFQNRLGQYRLAIQTIKKTLALADKCADRWAEGMAHVWWGESLWRLGEYDTAVNKLNHALTIAKDINAIFIAGWCHHQLGIVHDIQSRYDKAHEHLEQACAAWQSINNVQALSGSLNSVGLVNYHKEDLPAAQRALEQALDISNQLNDRHRQSHLINNLSLIATEQGDYDGANYYLTLGLNLASTSGNRHMEGAILTNLGRNYHYQGKLDSAITNLEQGLKISKSIGDRALTVEALLNLAWTKRSIGDLQTAESLYMEALKIARENDLTRLECEALIDITELLGKVNEKKARQFSQEAVVIAKSLQNPHLLKRVNSAIELFELNRSK